jgi:beta-phosphoglucomutase
MNAVIFDMDGVLVLTGDAHYQAWQAAAASDGIELSFEQFSHTFGRTNPDVIRMIWHELAGRPLSTLTAARLHEIADAKERAFRDLIRHDVPLAPGTRELLEQLASRGFALGVGSSAPRENLDLVLDGAAIRPYFAAVVDGSMVARGKPDPEVFLLAARHLAVDPAHCTVIEDAPAGIEAAVAAGMHALGVTTTHDEASLRAAGAHRIRPSLDTIEVFDVTISRDRRRV